MALGPSGGFMKKLLTAPHKLAKKAVGATHKASVGAVKATTKAVKKTANPRSIF